MSYLLLNAAMIPNEGTFTYRLLSREQAAKGQPQAEDWEYGVLRCQALAELQAK